jgi:transcriptional regulator with XRE-family HTH domain
VAKHWLAQRRKERKLTQGQLADLLIRLNYPVTQSTISHWEAGRYQVPLNDFDAVYALCEALGLTMQELMSRAGMMQDAVPMVTEKILQEMPVDARELLSATKFSTLLLRYGDQLAKYIGTEDEQLAANMFTLVLISLDIMQQTRLASSEFLSLMQAVADTKPAYWEEHQDKLLDKAMEIYRARTK